MDAGVDAASQNHSSVRPSVFAMWLTGDFRGRKPISLATVCRETEYANHLSFTAASTLTHLPRFFKLHQRKQKSKSYFILPHPSYIFIILWLLGSLCTLLTTYINYRLLNRLPGVVPLTLNQLLQL